MNRAARRRKEREKQIEDKTINIKYSELEQIKEDSTREATAIAFKILLGIPVMVLRDKWGFGKKRLTKYTDQLLEALDSFEKGYFTIEDVDKVLKDEVDITIREEK